MSQVAPFGVNKDSKSIIQLFYRFVCSCPKLVDTEAWLWFAYLLWASEALKQLCNLNLSSIPCGNAVTFCCLLVDRSNKNAPTHNTK